MTQDTATVEAEQAPAAEPDQPTPTPDVELGEGGKKALEAERAARKAAQKATNDALAKIKEYEDRDKTELERLTEQAAQAKAEADNARTEMMRLKIAANSKLPEEFHEFLTGTDEETVQAQADKLAAAMAVQPDGGRSPAPDPSQGARANSGPAQLTREDLAGKPPEWIEEQLLAGRLNAIRGIA
jgi:hypothetical protein